MAAVIRRVGQCQLTRRGGRFDVLARSILSQQISVQAARTIRRRLQRLLPGGRISAVGIDRLSDEQLQAVGISLQKRGYLRNLTSHVLAGTVNFRRLARIPDEAVITELTAVKGVGRWTAQMFLLSGLGRPDIFAPDDLGLKMRFGNCMGSVSNRRRKSLKELQKTGRRIEVQRPGTCGDRSTYRWMQSDRSANRCRTAHRYFGS